MAEECWKTENENAKTVEFGSSFQDGVSTPRFSGRHVCWSCGEPGHLQWRCPKFQGSKSVQKTGPKKAGLALAGASASGSLPAHLDTCEGYVNGVECTILLDSGSEVAGARRSLAQDDQFVEET